MAMNNELQKFINAQIQDYDEAFLEVQQGYKRSHWMWYIFPQIYGLGYSKISQYYAIKSIDEARDYLNNEYLYSNLINICNELLKLESSNPIEIFGETDAIKLKSSMTLFNYVNDIDKKEIATFNNILNKFYNGEKDDKTLKILEKEMKN